MAFKSEINGVKDTYVYSQVDNGGSTDSVSNYSLAKLAGVDAAGITTDMNNLHENYIHIA